MSVRTDRAVLLLIAAATALRLALAAITDLGLDEAYALAVSRNLQLSWFDHPPLVFWIAGAMQALFGLGLPDLLVRLPFIALAAATTWLLYRVTEQHFGDRAGMWAALLFTLAPFFFLSAGSWVVPDGPLIFFMLLATWALTRIALGEGAQPRWTDWSVAGVALGLALLSKYHAALFALGAALTCLLHTGLRPWLRRPQPYVAVLVALMLFIPVLVWNAQNEWVSFGFQLGRTSAGPSPADLLRVFAVEAVYLLPTTLLIVLTSLVWLALRRPEPRGSASFFLVLGLPIVLVVLANRLVNEEAYSHWAMPGWALLLPPAGAMLATWQARWRWAATATAGISLLQFVIVIAAVVLLLSSIRLPNDDAGRFRFEAGRWGGLAQALAADNQLQDSDFLVTLWWSDAARVAEALRVPQPTLVFSSDARGFAWAADQQRLLGADALIVTRTRHTEMMRQRLEGYFGSLEYVGRFPIEAGSPVMVDVTKGRELVKPYPQPYGPH